jgi:hypothetical protein
MRKNKTTKNFTNFKMNSDVYALRCKVMSVIYSLYLVRVIIILVA